MPAPVQGVQHHAHMRGLVHDIVKQVLAYTAVLAPRGVGGCCYLHSIQETGCYLMLMLPQLRTLLQNTCIALCVSILHFEDDN